MESQQEIKEINKSTILNLAHSGFDETEMELLLKSYPDLNAQDEEGNTLLHDISEMGNRKCARILVEQGANANIKNKLGQTPLHIACLRVHPGVVSFLVKRRIKHKADPDAQDENGDTSIILLSKCTNSENYSSAATVAATLMNQNVNPNIKNKIGRTALHYAAENGNKDFIRILLMAGLDPHSLDNHDQSPLSLCKTEELKKLILTDYSELL